MTIRNVTAVLAGALLAVPVAATAQESTERPGQHGAASAPVAVIGDLPGLPSERADSGPLALQLTGLVQRSGDAAMGTGAGASLDLQLRHFGRWVPMARVTTVFGGGEPGFMGALQVGVRYTLEPLENLTIAPGLALGPGLAQVGGGLQFAPYADVDLYAAYTLWRRVQVFGAVGVGWSRYAPFSAGPQPEWISHQRLMLGLTVDPYADPRPYEEAFGEQ
jgi:hypothetical protein